MTNKLLTPHGTFSFKRFTPGGSLLFESEATGQTLQLSIFEINRWLRSGTAKILEQPARDCWDAWGCPESLINDEGTGWGVE
jgi:hypothetical protein